MAGITNNVPEWTNASPDRRLPGAGEDGGFLGSYKKTRSAFQSMAKRSGMKAKLNGAV